MGVKTNEGWRALGAGLSTFGRMMYDLEQRKKDREQQKTLRDERLEFELERQERGHRNALSRGVQDKMLNLEDDYRDWAYRGAQTDHLRARTDLLRNPPQEPPELSYEDKLRLRNKYALGLVRDKAGLEEDAPPEPPGPLTETQLGHYLDRSIGRFDDEGTYVPGDVIDDPEAMIDLLEAGAVPRMRSALTDSIQGSRLPTTSATARGAADAVVDEMSMNWGQRYGGPLGLSPQDPKQAKAIEKGEISKDEFKEVQALNEKYADLLGSVPPGSQIIREENGRVYVRNGATGQTEIYEED